MQTNRRGFTLVEILVVIAIIAILAALSVKGLSMAMWGSKQTVIKLEINGLDTAMKTYKDKYGSYPCDLGIVDPSTGDVQMGTAAFRAHLAKRFPRFAGASSVQVDTSSGAPTQKHAIAFWLMNQFSTDPRNPLLVTGANVTLDSPLFDFDKTRLKQDGVMKLTWSGQTSPVLIPLYIYTPANGRGVPYVYFDSRNYSAAGSIGIDGNRYVDFGAGGIAAPYAFDVDSSRTLMTPGTDYTDSNSNGTYDAGESILYDPLQLGCLNVKLGGDTWANPDSFQIISAGQDGVFGCSNSDPFARAVRLFPTGTAYAPADDDNVTNFCKGNCLQSDKP